MTRDATASAQGGPGPAHAGIGRRVRHPLLRGLRHLALGLTGAVVAVGTLLLLTAGVLLVSGSVTVGTAVRAVGPSPLGGLTHALGGRPTRAQRQAVRAERRAGGRALEEAGGWQAGCADPLASSEDARVLIGVLQAAGAPGVPNRPGDAVTVLSLSPRLASGLSEGTQAAMLVVGRRGILVLTPDVHQGSTVYHELVHWGQFRRPPAAQAAYVDSVRQADQRLPLPPDVATQAWGSVRLLLAWQQPPKLLDDLDAAVLAALAEPAGAGVTPLQHLGQAAARALSAPEFAPLQVRLGQVERIRDAGRGAAASGAVPSAWPQELQRLLVFEAAAYMSVRRCLAVTPPATAPRVPRTQGEGPPAPTRHDAR